MSKAILSIKPMPPGPMPTLDPFLFCVYHKDQYPAGNSKLEAPRVGNGQDFDPSQKYRMYHGESVPGFPQHPHRGFETITATMTGLIDHADSVGNAGRYGDGDLQWMTAGGGVVHSEMFPLINQKSENPLRFFQIWLNLPAASKMVDPGFAMFWNNDVPVYKTDMASVTVWAGDGYFGVEKNNAPPPASWAADADHDVAIWHLTIQPGGTLELPAARTGKDVSRSMFYVEGESELMKIDGQQIHSKVVVDLAGDAALELSLSEEASTPGEFLLLQGKPIAEPVQQYGPFVMNTKAEIQQAFSDYQKTGFGGWPWARDDMVFPADKGRFAKLQGVETIPDEGSCEAK